MKTNIAGKQHSTHAQKQPVKRPENKDDLDSREGEEELDKGDGITHNEKAKHSALKSRNKK